MIDSIKIELKDYFYDEVNENSGYNYLYGPDGFKCFLGEPEDRYWYRDASPVVSLLNKQHQEILDLKEENQRLQFRLDSQ